VGLGPRLPVPARPESSPNLEEKPCRREGKTGRRVPKVGKRAEREGQCAVQTPVGENIGAVGSVDPRGEVKKEKRRGLTPLQRGPLGIVQRFIRGLQGRGVSNGGGRL